MLDKSSSERLLEKDLKVLVLNKLVENGFLDDSSLIMTEVTIGNFSRRVDLAILNNGKWIAFEIKSEADSLIRLRGQVDKYLEYFDKVIVVASEKFSKDILEKTPEHVGLWEVSSNSKIKLKRRGKIKEIKEKTKLIELLDTIDLKKVSKDLKIKAEKNRKSLEKTIEKATQKKLREALHTALIRKFGASNKNFKNKVNGNPITVFDLEHLSRYSHQRAIKNRNKLNDFWVNFESHIENLKNK